MLISRDVDNVSAVISVLIINAAACCVLSAG